MKIFHLSYHVGCINDLNYVFTQLGHQIDFEKISFPNCSVTCDIASKYWTKNKDKLQTYDVIITSDTVALSYIFLLHLQELIPHLVILNCNRFDYNMYSEQMFYHLLRELNKTPEKITFIPWTDFEQIWCAKHSIFISEQPIPPIGKWLAESIYTHKGIAEDFGEVNHINACAPIENTLFIQKYFNHTQFMDLPQFLTNNNISVAHGGYTYFNEINKYKGVVVLPDAFSKYFTFESIQHGILVYLPSQKFLLDLVNNPKYFFNILGSGGKLHQEFINLCEWYHYPETRIYFDSFDDLIKKINETTEEIKNKKLEWMKYYGSVIEKTHLIKWKNICDKIKIRDNMLSN